jgi:hypothetical protein
MDVDRVKVLVARGLSIYCATCTKYWRGREAGLPGSECTALVPCGSPLAKMDFPEYEGPIREHTQYCFVCSAPARYGVQTRGSKRVFGMCAEHIAWLKELAPVATGKPAVGSTDVRTPTSGIVSAERLLKKPRSLWQAIADTEAEIAKEEARKG